MTLGPLRFPTETRWKVATEVTSPDLRHRQILAIFTLVMMGVSWPLWLESPDVPHFPAFSIAAHPPLARSLTVACTGGLLLCLTHKLGRLGSLVVIISGVGLILLDQQRLQAWFYQTLVIATVYAALPGSVAIGFTRFFAITLYFHSALSKLDWSFAHSMGPYLLSPLTGLTSLSPDSPLIPQLSIALPVGELIITLLLAAGYFRIGRAGVIGIHFCLIGMLGPWALNHSANVLIWNLSMICQTVVLFGRHDQSVAPVASPMAIGIVQLLMLVVSIMPFFERAGLWDAWPSFALYAGHVEQMRLEIPLNQAEKVPEELRPYLRRSAGMLVPDLTLWARARMGTPPYPAVRIQKKLARYFAEKSPPDITMRATFMGKANWRNGRRDQKVMADRQTILDSISK
jgi:hypothetical protein